MKPKKRLLQKRMTGNAKKQRFISFLAMAVCAGILFANHYLLPPAADIPPDTPRTEERGDPGCDKREIPGMLTGRKEQIIFHEGYTVSYNPDYKIANWVAYELTADEANSKNVKRGDNFIPDPSVADNETATNEDYKHSGFDRGHLAPAGDMKWSANAMQESFYFSNICPQNRNLNTGIWNVLENQCRKWAAQYGTLLIVTGPVIDDNLRRLGPHHVAIPKIFYKVICIPSPQKPKGIGFLFENKDYGATSLPPWAVSIDSVELVTGIDFFPSFPAEVQEIMEASTRWDY